MQSAAVAFDQIRQRRYLGRALAQLGKGQIRDALVPAEHAQQVEVVDHHRLEVARPAHIELDPPDTGID